MQGIGSTVVLVGTLFVLASSLASAQDQKKFIEEERRKEMDARPKLDDELKQPLLWDAGGWLHAQIDHLDDPPFRDQRDDRYLDLRLWGQVQLDRTYTGFVRVQMDYLDFNSGDQFKSSDDNRFRVRLDQAWLQADWTESGRGLALRGGRSSCRSAAACSSTTSRTPFRGPTMPTSGRCGPGWPIRSSTRTTSTSRSRTPTRAIASSSASRRTS
jgi:hypothetical protein